MNDLGKLFWGIIVGILAQVLTFFQLQGQLKYEFLKDNYWLTLLIGIVLSFNGEMWPSRLIGFSIGAIVFSLLSYYIFNEPINLKTGICLGLALLILIIQLFWK